MTAQNMEVQGRHLAERLALLLNQADERGLEMVAGIDVDGQPFHAITRDDPDDSHSYGFDVARSKEGQWIVGQFFRREEVDDDGKQDT